MLQETFRGLKVCRVGRGGASGNLAYLLESAACSGSLLFHKIVGRIPLNSHSSKLLLYYCTSYIVKSMKRSHLQPSDQIFPGRF